MQNITAPRYFLYLEPTDMRMGYDGLSGLVSSRLGKDPRSGDLFIFITEDGRLYAVKAAIIYFLLATCKIRDFERYAWLKNILEIIPDYPANLLEQLLPA